MACRRASTSWSSNPQISFGSRFCRRKRPQGRTRIDLLLLLPRTTRRKWYRVGLACPHAATLGRGEDTAPYHPQGCRRSLGTVHGKRTPPEFGRVLRL